MINDDAGNDHNAFQMAKGKKQNKQRVLELKALVKAEPQGQDTIVWFGYLASEMAKAEPSGSHRGPGFATKATFEFDGDEYELSSPWMGLKSR